MTNNYSLGQSDWLFAIKQCYFRLVWLMSLFLYFSLSCITYFSRNSVRKVMADSS